MVRKTLEGTCADQGAASGPLASRLRDLQGEGKIDGMLVEWANILRVVGNEGAHFTGTTMSREDAEDALALAEALLDHLYVLRNDSMSSRRGGPNKGRSDDSSRLCWIRCLQARLVSTASAAECSTKSGPSDLSRGEDQLGVLIKV